MPSRLKQIPESLLAKLWKERAARAESLRAANGRRIKVIYPGREGTTAGPDFRDALFEEEGVGLVRGDVEVHVTGAGWRAHGHHQDPRYNGVVLHVVGRADEAYSRLSGGRQAPVLSIGPLFNQQQPLGKEPGLWPLLESYEYLPPGNADEAASLLDRAGDHWFSNVTDSFSRLLQEEEPEQLLYSSLMEALGYSQNRQPFLDLAHRVPYSRLLKAALKVPRSGRRLAIQDTLLKVAGFPADPSQTISTNTLGWHLFRVRPQNHPRRRIMGFARVLDLFLPGETVSPTHQALGVDGRFEPRAWTVSRPSEMDRSSEATHTMANGEDPVPPWANLGLVTGMAQLVSSGTEQRDDHRRCRVLEAGLMGMGSHPSRKDTLGIREGNLIGTARARDMAVNCALPFLHALGRMSDDYPLAEAALELYRRFPKLQDNEITREMWQRLFAPLRNAHSTNPPHSEDKGWERLVSNARRQQGLLHLHHMLTSLGTFSSR